MSQALKLWLTPHQIVEQTGSRLAANLAKIDFTGCRRIGQLFGHHRRHELRASQIERQCELGEPRAFSDHDAEDSQPARREQDVQEIERASCGERACQYVYSKMVAENLKKNKIELETS